jgi:hypothetical protein
MDKLPPQVVIFTPSLTRQQAPLARSAAAPGTADFSSILVFIPREKMFLASG